VTTPPPPAGAHRSRDDLPLHVVVGSEPGPTALVQAGIHGDEIAGVHALVAWVAESPTIDRGRLIIVPVMNPPAYAAGSRSRPGGADLNRSFPGDASSDEPEQRLAARFMDLVTTEQPDLVVTLHESPHRHRAGDPETMGQTIVYGATPRPDIVDRTIERLNADHAEVSERWVPLHYPIPTSSTEVIVAATGSVGLCVETWSGFALARRIAMHRTVVRLLLEEIGMLDAPSRHPGPT
jgi:predicted deacylase